MILHPTLCNATPADECPPELIKQAIKEVQTELQVPWDVVFLTMLASMSTVCAPLCDVTDPNGKVDPPCVFGAVILDSGQGKTSVARIINKPIFDFDRAQELDFEAKLQHHRAVLAGWSAIRQRLLWKLTDALKRGDPIVDLQNEIARHERGKPKKPRLRRIIRNKLSKRALSDGLDGIRQVIALMVDEGGMLLDRDFVDLIAHLTKAWDGDTIVIDRGNGASTTAIDPRMTFALLIQSGVLDRYLKKHGDFMRESGFLARLLVAKPVSMQGFRFFENKTHKKPALAAVHARMRELLCMDRSTRIVLEFNEYARIRWFNYANEFEQLTQPARYLCDTPDLASKAMGHITRIAALFHFFMGEKGPITVESLERAHQIVWHYTHEWKRVFATPQVVFDAQALESDLHRRYLTSGATQYPHNYIRQNGPECIREKSRLDSVINKLINEGKIWITPGKNNTRIVNISEPYFANLPRF